MATSKKQINGITLDYVSGSLRPFLKIGSGSTDAIKHEGVEDFKKLLDWSQTHLKGYFVLSTLFNAFQEEKDGKVLKEENKLNHDAIYADSGGLQVLTRGLEITDDIKLKVYDTQAKYCDFAMTFDEMPLKVIENQDQFGKSIIDNNRVVHIKEMVGISAKNSAAHIQQQIDVFEKLKTNTKILPIVHGFSEETYIEYAETIMKNLHNIKEHIQGMAIASLSASADNKVGIMKVFDYVPTLMNAKEIKEEYRQHVHLLGVASYQRIIPVMMMAKKGIFDTVKRISFDSTALTKSYTFGRVYASVEEMKNPKDYEPLLSLNHWKDPHSKNIRQFYNNVHNLLKDYPDYIFEDVEDLMNHSQNNGEKLKVSEQFKKYGTEYERKYLAQVRYNSIYNMIQYLSVIEAYLEDELAVADIFSYNGTVRFMFETFEHNAHTKEDFKEMCNYFYTTATTGRTNLNYIIMDTLEEFEKSEYGNNPDVKSDPLAELGVGEVPKHEKGYVRPDLLARRAKRAPRDFKEDGNPSDSLF